MKMKQDCKEIHILMELKKSYSVSYFILNSLTGRHLGCIIHASAYEISLLSTFYSVVTVARIVWYVVVRLFFFGGGA